MFCVGLTGGIGSGKTTVSNMFHKLGVKIIDADIISRELTRIDQPAYHAIIEQFGPEVIDQTKELRRDYLRQLIFSDKDLKIKLENIIHPLVRTEINLSIKDSDHPYNLISIALLFESNSNYNLDRILVIDLPEQLQITRTCSRDNTDRQEILKIIQSQFDREKRLEKADDIICNDKQLKSLETQVEMLHKKYLQLIERIK